MIGLRIGPGSGESPKVGRIDLQDAASIAGLMITTEAGVAEAPKGADGHASHDHGGGGMGGMM
jgi:chaperonin GroEL